MSWGSSHHQDLVTVERRVDQLQQEIHRQQIEMVERIAKLEAHTDRNTRLILATLTGVAGLVVSTIFNAIGGPTP